MLAERALAPAQHSSTELFRPLPPEDRRYDQAVGTTGVYRNASLKRRVMEEPDRILRSLLESVILPIHRDRWGASDAWDAWVDFQRQLGSHGWTAPGWPVEIGGLGLTVEQQVACEGVYFDLEAPRRVSVYGVNNIGPTIAAHGTPEQKRHLRAIVDVDEIWCQGFSEPDAGSDLAGLRTRADLDDGEFTINGQKIWTSIGLNATHCLLLARTDPEASKHRGISAFLVPL